MPSALILLVRVAWEFFLGFIRAWLAYFEERKHG